MHSSHFSQTSQTPPKLTLLCYILGLCERFKRACQQLEVKTVCRSRSTLKNALVQGKQPSEDRKKKAVVYEEPCKGCGRVYNRETSKTREQRAQECDVESQHQQWTCSTGWTNQHRVDWKAAKTREMEGIVLEEEGAGSPAHPLPAAHL